MLHRAPLLLLIVLLPSLAAPRPAGAEPLPGLLDRAAVEAGRQKAAGQKRDAQAVIRNQAKILGYDEAQIERALKPTMVRQGSFQVSLKDGTVVEFPWHRIGFAENRLANTDKAIARDTQGRALGHETNKGGVRLHHGVFADEVYALALKMDTKLAMAGDALGGHAFRGAKGGIGAGRVVKVGSRFKAKVGDYVDPAAPVFNRAEIMRRFARSYRQSGGDVGPGLDIQAGDVNTKAAEMKVLAHSYGSARKPSAGVSGKAVRTRKDGSIDPRGGIQYRAVSTGEGVWISARLAARHAGLKLRGATVVAQGWGEVGRAFGRAALADGARVIAVQELWTVGGKRVAGVLHHPLGARAKPAQVKRWLAEVDQARKSGADLKTYKGGKLLRTFKAGQDASAVKADIVGLNAMGNVLTKQTVPAYLRSGTHQGKRKILAEGANLAETGDGARLLDKNRGKLLAVAGDLANLGGVHVSNLEAVQNSFAEAVSSPRAKKSLLSTLRKGWNRVLKTARAQGVSERQAIELVAVDGMMRRSLGLKGAPRQNLETRVISEKARAARSSLFSSLGRALRAPSRQKAKTRTKTTTTKRTRTARVPRWAVSNKGTGKQTRASAATKKPTRARVRPRAKTSARPRQPVRPRQPLKQIPPSRR